MGSYFAAAGAGGPGGFAEPDPGLVPGPEQGNGSRTGGPGQRRPSAWSWGRCAWRHC